MQRAVLRCCPIPAMGLPAREPGASSRQTFTECADVLGLRREGPGGLLGHLGGELRQALAVLEHALNIAANQSTLEADEVRDRPAAQKIGHPLQVLQQALLPEPEPFQRDGPGPTGQDPIGAGHRLKVIRHLIEQGLGLPALTA